MSGKSGGKADMISKDLNLASDNFKELARLREAEREAEDKIKHAEAMSEEMTKEAEIEGERLFKAEMERIQTELEEKYVIEEQKVHEEVKRIMAAGEAEAVKTKKNGEARIDEAVDAVVRNLAEGA